jgi:hypothetical protein
VGLSLAHFGQWFSIDLYFSIYLNFEYRYTIIIVPFNFTFDHYAESGFLIREQYEIMPELVRRAIFAEYDYQVLSDRHSIGCKYIVLL